jgi:nucleoside-diphosphate-sugar epimerase
MAGNFHTIEAMKAFITGGSGFIGSHLIDFLSAQNAEIFALVRDPEKAIELKKKNINILEGNLFSLPSLPAGIDIVFHLAGKIKSLKAVDYYTVNQEGTASLFRALLSSGTRPKVIYLSSLAASGPSDKDKGVKENDPPHPVTPYGRSKLMGEKEALKFKGTFSLIILRASAVFGPRDRDFFEYFKVISRGILPTVRESKLISLCYVKDLVEALYLCAQKDLPSGEILNIADPQPRTWEELGEAAGLAMGKKFRKVRISMGLLSMAALLSELIDRLKEAPGLFNRDKYTDLKQSGWVADVGKAAEMLSFRPRYTLEKAIRETMDWYIAQKWL